MTISPKSSPIALLVCLLNGAPLAAQVVRTFVSTNGSDANACSRTAPCRNFNAALAAVSAGGEVVALDSGGYGAASVSKAATIIAPAGVHAAIAPTSGTALTIAAAPTDVITLRNIFLQGQGAQTGLDYTGGLAVHLDGCSVSHFLEGIQHSNAGYLGMRNSLMLDIMSAIFINASFGTPKLLLQDSRIERAETGLTANHGEVTMDGMHFVDCGDWAVWVRGNVGTGGQAHIIRSLVTGSLRAIRAGTTLGIAEITVTDSELIRNDTALEADFDSVIRVAETTITRNSVGVTGTGSVISFGNNRVRGNDTNGTFTATVLPE